MSSQLKSRLIVHQGHIFKSFNQFKKPLGEKAKRLHRFTESSF